MARVTQKTLRLSEGTLADLLELKAMLAKRWPGIDLREADVIRWAITTASRVTRVAQQRVHTQLKAAEEAVASSLGENGNAQGGVV